jgi:hypothetical protein
MPAAIEVLDTVIFPEGAGPFPKAVTPIVSKRVATASFKNVLFLRTIGSSSFRYLAEHHGNNVQVHPTRKDFRSTFFPHLHHTSSLLQWSDFPASFA